MRATSQFFISLFYSINMNEKTIELIITLVTVVFNGGIFFSIIANGKDILRKKTTLFFLGSTAFLILWAIFNYLADVADSNAQALFFTRASFPMALIAELSFLTFSFLFPKRITDFKSIFIIETTLATPFLIIPFTDGIIKEVTTDPDEGITDFISGPLHLPFAILITFILAHLAFNLFIQYRRSKDSGSRSQARLMLIGWGLFSAGSFTTNLILPFLTQNAAWSKFGPAFSMILVACVGYAIAHHHFLDIRVIIQRGIIYVLFSSSVFTAYFLLVSVFGLFIGQNPRIGFLASGALVAIFGATAAKPLENFLKRKTDNIFFKDHYDLDNAVRMIGDTAKKNLNRNDAIRQVSISLRKILKVETISFLRLRKENRQSDFSRQELGILRDNRSIIDCSGANCRNINWTPRSSVISIAENQALTLLHEKGFVVFLPLIRNRTPEEYILLGAKRSGDRYSSDDFRFLASVAPHISAILEKARLYEKDRQHLKLLEQRVDERTKELHDLQKDQREIMVDIAHNLQSPLTTVKGILDLLHPKDTEQQQNLAVAQRAVDRVSKFIYDLLTLTRFEVINKDVPFAPISIETLLKDLVDEYKVMTAGERVEFKIQSDTRGIIIGNQHLLEQLFGNIIGNAIKYRKPSEPLHVTLRITCTEKLIDVTIQDDGVGIAEDDVQNLFQRFRRFGGEKPVRGSGLGLAISKKITQLHSGSISAKSALGIGSSFSVSFPIQKKKWHQQNSGTTN